MMNRAAQASQVTVDNSIIDYIITYLQPFNTTEKPLSENYQQRWHQTEPSCVEKQ